MSEVLTRAVGYSWSVGASLWAKLFDDISDDEEPSVPNQRMPESHPYLYDKPINTNTEKYSTNNTTQQNKTQIKAQREHEREFHSLEVQNTNYEVQDEESRYSSLTRPKRYAASKTKNKPNNTDLKYSTWNDRWRDNDGIKSSTDLTSGKWEHFGYKNYGYSCNSSESDIFQSRSVLSTNPNDIYQKPLHLVKSSSSSHLPHVRSSNYLPSVATTGRTIKHNSGNNSGSGSAVSRQISHHQQLPTVPSILFSQSSSVAQSNGKCSCQCHQEPKKQLCAESTTSLEYDPETPEGLSWRRLHMSRAKLKATSTTSELLSGFAMVAMVELQVNTPTNVPEWLFVLFTVCTTVLVSVHIFALMISTYLLPNIDAVSKLHVSSMVTESPHDKMKTFIELAWAFSTILGLFLFLVEIAIVCWVKFWDFSFTAAISATMIVIPVLIVFVAFAMHFYHSLVVIKCKTSVTDMNELENMKKQLDTVSPA